MGQTKLPPSQTKLAPSGSDAINIERAATPRPCFHYFKKPSNSCTPHHVFTVLGGKEECWKYCKVMKECSFFSVNLTSLTCSIYSDLMAYTNAVSSHDKNSVMGSKSVCLEFNQTCPGASSLAEVASGGGLIIKTLHHQCLTTTDRHIKRADTTFRFISWNRCSNADRWSINQLVNKGTEDVKISLEGTDECLTRFKSNDDIPTLALAPCQRDDPSQEILLIHSNFSCIFSLHRSITTKIERPGLIRNVYIKSVGDPVLQYLFRLEREWEEPCRMKHLKIAKGAVTNIEDKPFFLPGSNITFQCQKGYGVKIDGYTREFQQSCSQDMVLSKCSLIPPKDPDSFNFRPVLIAVLSVGVLVFISGAIVCGHGMMNNKLQKITNQDNERSTSHVDGDDTSLSSHYMNTVALVSLGGTQTKKIGESTDQGLISKGLNVQLNMLLL